MKIKVILNDREECLLDVEDVWKRDYAFDELYKINKILTEGWSSKHCYYRGRYDGMYLISPEGNKIFLTDGEIIPGKYENLKIRVIEN